MIEELLEQLDLKLIYLGGLPKDESLFVWHVDGLLLGEIFLESSSKEWRFSSEHRIFYYSSSLLEEITKCLKLANTIQTLSKEPDEIKWLSQEYPSEMERILKYFNNQVEALIQANEELEKRLSE